MSIARWISDIAAQSPDRVALRLDSALLTYGELDKRVVSVSAILRHEHGIGRGDRVAWLGYNNPDMIVLLFGLARLGAILVPFNWRQAAPELTYMVEDCDPRLIVGEPEFADTLDLASGGRPVLVVGGESPGLTKASRSSEGVPDQGRPEDVVLINYTSGTTGRPKGVMLTQTALDANAINAHRMHDMTPGDHVLTVLPLFHVGGLNVQTLPALKLGARVTLHDRFRPAATLTDIQDFRPTLTTLVPATMQAMIAEAAWETADLGSLRAIATGSSEVPLHLMRAFESKGPAVIQIYGLTETSPIAIHQMIADRGGERRDKEFGAIGRPAVGTSVRLLAPGSGVDLNAGEVGEIVVKGRQVTTGYWNDPDASRAAIRQGWFHTGDLGYRDANGCFWFTDRLKNMIISGGENIHPAELTRVLMSVPGVREATVVGIEDATWGEVPVAVIVAEDPDGDLDARVQSALAEKLARFKHPRAILSVDSLPRTALGKIQTDAVKKLVSERSGNDRARDAVTT